MQRLIIIMIAISIVGLTACESKKEETKQELAQTPAGMHTVKVIESIDASNYTYIHVSENGKDYWMAAPQMKVEKGETLYYAKSMEMKNFHSETLNRTFDRILFVEDVRQTPPTQTNFPTAELKSTHSQVASLAKENISVEPLKGGKTIEQIYANKKSLSGKTIKVRGKVVKFNPNIMDRNWVHIQDGTGNKDNYDLIITTNDNVQVGQVVVAEGKVVLNKDFGAGYSYPVLLESAKVKPE